MQAYPSDVPLPSNDKRWKLVEGTMRRHGHKAAALIEVLRTVQESFGFLDEVSLRFVASSLRLPMSKVYGVATFYHYFSLKPPGEHTACMVDVAKFFMDFTRVSPAGLAQRNCMACLNESARAGGAWRTWRRWTSRGHGQAPALCGLGPDRTKPREQYAEVLPRRIYTAHQWQDLRARQVRLLQGAGHGREMRRADKCPSEINIRSRRSPSTARKCAQPNIRPYSRWLVKTLLISQLFATLMDSKESAPAGYLLSKSEATTNFWLPA